MSEEKPFTRERLLRILDGQARKTAHAIAGLDEATADQAAREDGWTAKEILAHMASGHEGMLALAQGRAPAGVAPESFDLDAYNEEQRQRAAGWSLAEVIARLEAARAAVRSYILELDEADYGATVHTPWLGDHTQGQFLVFPALHEGGHRAELERWRAAVEGGGDG